MESKYGKANRIWVMNRGMVSEENIEFMQERGARYIVGTPMVVLRTFEQELLAKDWEEVRPGVEVKRCASPEGSDEVFVLCRSEGRKEKEAAILMRFMVRLEARLAKLKVQADSGKLLVRQKAERRIGSLLERNSRAASIFEVRVTEKGAGKEMRLAFTIKKRKTATSGRFKAGQLYVAHQLEGS